MGNLSHYAKMRRNRSISLGGTGKPVPYGSVVQYSIYRGGVVDEGLRDGGPVPYEGIGGAYH